MYFAKTQLNWFDLLVVGLIALGIWRGRKRGLSEELLDVLQWICIVVVGALMYRPVASALSAATRLPAFYSNVFSYIIIALAIKLLFNLVRRAAGTKLVQSDAF